MTHNRENVKLRFPSLTKTPNIIHIFPFWKYPTLKQEHTGENLVHGVKWRLLLIKTIEQQHHHCSGSMVTILALYYSYHFHHHSFFLHYSIAHILCLIYSARHWRFWMFSVPRGNILICFSFRMLSFTQGHSVINQSIDLMRATLAPNFMTIHPMGVETFHLKPKMSTLFWCCKSQRDLSPGECECLYKPLWKSIQ